MLKILKIVCALASLLFGALWLLSVAGSGFNVPDWVPPTFALATGVYLVLDVFDLG